MFAAALALAFRELAFDRFPFGCLCGAIATKYLVVGWAERFAAIAGWIESGCAVSRNVIEMYLR